MESRSPGGGSASGADLDGATRHPPPEGIESETTATASEQSVADPTMSPPANTGTPAQEDVEMSDITVAAPSTPKTSVEVSLAPTIEPLPITSSEVVTEEIQSSVVNPPSPERATSPLANKNPSEFATPTQATRDFRNIILAAQSAQSQGMFMQGSIPPSPVVQPGVLHELGDIDTPNQRRSSAVGGIAGLEELRNRLDEAGAEADQSRFDQLLQAAKLNGNDEECTPVVDAFLRLDFEDGNVYYIRNPSVVFGRAEGATAGYYSHIGPDGSTIIETGPRGFGLTTSSGLTSMKREKKKRKKKKDDAGLVRKTKSTTSESVTPGPSRRSSGFGQPPRFRDPFGLTDMFEAEEPVIHLPLSNASVDNNAPLLPRKNISRRHARLFYNTPKRRFELEIMGKNGAFVDEEYVQAGSTIVVEEKGMKVQIGGISFMVIVPDMPPEHRLEERGDEEEDVAVAPQKFTGGKGKMSFAFHDENGNEVRTDYSEDEDIEMEDDELDSEEAGSDSDRQSDEEGADEVEDVESGEEGDEDDDQDDSEEEVEQSPSPEPAKRGRGRPKKSIADVRKREKELQRDRDRIKELQRQLKEKEREKAEAEAEATRQEREEQRVLEREQERKRERERERERTRAREKERDRIREEKKKKKATEKAVELQRQKDARQKEKEMLRAAKEREKERERDKKKQKLHLPHPAAAKKEERKLYLPTTSSERSTPKPPPSPAQIPSTTQEARHSPLSLPQHPTMDSASSQLQIQPQTQLQPQPQPQMYSTSAQVIDPALYETSASPMNPMMQDMSYLQHPAIEKPRKEKLPSRQKKLRSPSPEINEADLSPEALAKPNISYVVMIHEAILNSAERVLSLPQIYKAIETKYPYYKFKVTTNGWQSSVRHNLGQHKAFYKVDRAGKGWLWGVVDGVSIEKEKKGSASKLAIPPGYDGLNGHGMMHPPSGQIGHPSGMAQLPSGYLQQTGNMAYHGINGTNSLHNQSHMGGIQAPKISHQHMHQQPIGSQGSQVPPPPNYMPMKQHQQSISAVHPNPRTFEAPIPMPNAATGPQNLEQKPDVKQLIALLSKVVAQRQAQMSTDPNANKSLEQLKGFLSQLASGKTNPGALETVTNIVNSFKQSAPSVTAGKAPMAPSPPDPNIQVASHPTPSVSHAPLSSTSPLTQGLFGGKAPSKSPGKAPTVNLANLQQHIKTMSPEERAKWTKKLLEIKQKNAAAASAAQLPSGGPATSAFSRPTTAGKAPVLAGKAPVLAGKAPVTAGKRPAGKMPSKSPQLAETLKNMSPEMLQQYLEKLKANQAMKRPLDISSSRDGTVEPPSKKLDVGAKE